MNRYNNDESVIIVEILRKYVYSYHVMIAIIRA
jgi:hypothetical protein